MVATEVKRVHNFSAGPGVLPVPVLEQAQSEMLSWRDTGMSVMEMSHRSAAFEEIIHTAEADLRQLLNIPNNYKVVFLQGGASLQFAMLPMNLLGQGQSADYILTGEWSQKAYKEAKKFGQARVAFSSEDTGFNRVPAQAELQLDPQAAYTHFTSNNTIYGTEWLTEPSVQTPLACDASSDIMSRPLDITKYGLLYGGAQKNAGAAGATIVVIREDLLERVPSNLATMLDYKLQAEKESLYNTPPTYSIYIMGLVLKWLQSLGGLSEIERRNIQKSDTVYRAIDRSGGFYRGHAESTSRSRMNVTFKLPNEDLDKKFAKQATSLGLDGLKGYRTVGGIRASLYNALPLEAALALADFMEDFQRTNG